MDSEECSEGRASGVRIVAGMSEGEGWGMEGEQCVREAGEGRGERIGGGVLDACDENRILRRCDEEWMGRRGRERESGGSGVREWREEEKRRKEGEEREEGGRGRERRRCVRNRGEILKRKRSRGRLERERGRGEGGEGEEERRGEERAGEEEGGDGGKKERRERMEGGSGGWERKREMEGRRRRANERALAAEETQREDPRSIVSCRGTMSRGPWRDAPPSLHTRRGRCLLFSHASLSLSGAQPASSSVSKALVSGAATEEAATRRASTLPRALTHVRL